MPERNRFHSRTMTRVARFLDVWLDSQPEPRGQVLTGDAGVRLAEDPDTTLGVDVTYVSAEVMSLQTDEITIVSGVPILAVEILSPGRGAAAGRPEDRRVPGGRGSAGLGAGPAPAYGHGVPTGGRAGTGQRATGAGRRAGAAGVPGAGGKSVRMTAAALNNSTFIPKSIITRHGFLAVAGAQGLERLQRQRLQDEPDAAVGQGEVRPAGVPAAVGAQPAPTTVPKWFPTPPADRAAAAAAARDGSGTWC